MSNIEKFLNSQQAFSNQRQNLEGAYNNLGVEKQLYDVKKQALQSAQGLSNQLLGQERTEFLLGATPTIVKTAKVGLRLARDPAGTATAIKGQVEKGARDLFKKTTGRDLPQSAEEAKQAVGEEAQRTIANIPNPLSQVPPSVRENLRGGIIDDARRTAGLPPRDSDLDDIDDDLRFGLDRPTTIADRVADTRPPLAPPKDLPEPESVDFRTFQAPTREEGMKAVRAENERLAEEARVDRIKNIDPADLRPVEQPVREPTLSDRITNLEGHQTLKPTQTREADPIRNIEPSDIGLQLPRATAEDIASVPPPQMGRIPVSQAQRQVFGERDFPPPPRPAPAEQPVEGGLRGDSTIARALGNNREQTLKPEDLKVEQVSQADEVIKPQILQAQPQQQAEQSAPRTQADIEREFPSPPQQQAQSIEQQTDKQLQTRLDRLRGGDAPAEAPVEQSVAKEAVADTAEKTIAKTGAELGGEAAGLELPGIGELLMAGTLIGGLIKAGKEAREEKEQTAGTPPTQQPQPQQQRPQLTYDVAPTLDTSSYHNA
jgi:hypothetical protein